MAEPKRAELYDKAFYDVFIRASREDVCIECSSEKKASNLRHRLYAFRKALELDLPDHAAALLAPTITMRVEGTNLIVSSKEQSDKDVKLLKAAL